MMTERALEDMARPKGPTERVKIVGGRHKQNTFSNFFLLSLFIIRLINFGYEICSFFF